MLYLREQGLMGQQSRFEASQARLRDKDKAQEEHWKELDKQHDRTAEAAAAKFQNGVRNRSVQESKTALDEFDKGYAKRQYDAANLGIPLDPKDVQAYYTMRQQMTDQLNKLMAQPQAQPPGSTFGGSRFQGVLQNAAPGASTPLMQGGIREVPQGQ
jgi:hypothetical protein